MSWKSAYGDVNQGVASWLCSVYRDNNLFHHGTYQAPPAFAENHDREFAALQILLMAQIFIGCEQHVKPSVLSGIQQVAVAQCIPPLCSCFLDGMAFQRTGYAPRAFRGRRELASAADWSFKTGRRKIQNRGDLFAGDVELFHNFVNRHAVLKVLEDGGDGHARATETHAPLTFPGALSTAGQVDQSKAIAQPPIAFCEN